MLMAHTKRTAPADDTDADEDGTSDTSRWCHCTDAMSVHEAYRLEQGCQKGTGALWFFELENWMSSSHVCRLIHAN